jgi:glycosyltransferase involved in cell wall biosynthesis
MKLCLLTNDYPPVEGGISAYVKGLRQGFDTLGHQCEVLFFPVNASLLAEEQNVTTFPVKGRWTFSRFLCAKKALERGRDKIRGADLAIVSSWSPLGAAYKALLGKTKPKSVLIAYGNDVLEPMRSWRQTKRMKGVFEYFDVLAAISRYTASLCNRVTKKDVAIIGGGLDRRFLQDRAKHQTNGQEREFTFLSVGRLIERKGCGLVIESLARIRHLLSNWRYVIIGNGAYERELRDLALKHNLSRNVQIMVNVDSEKLLEWYRLSDVFVMVSREIPEKGEVEGLGLVYMEAAAARMPVIAGNSGGVPDVVTDGVNGILVNPQSVDDISHALLRLYKDNHLRKELGENGRCLAETEWRWETVAQRILEIVKESRCQEQPSVLL